MPPLLRYNPPHRNDGPWARGPLARPQGSTVPPPARSWYVRKLGKDTNGGSSPTVRSTGTDGVTTTGTNILTSASASWTSADVGHGIFIGGVAVYRIILVVIDANTIKFSGATITTGSGRSWTVGGAWLTIGQSMAASMPIVGGDTVYIGAGVYRETSTGPGSPTSVQNQSVTWTGDVDGSHTGDSGYVIWSNALVNDHTVPVATTLVTLTSVNNLAFNNIIFYAGSAATFSILLCKNITFYKCCFFSSNQVCVGVTVGFGVNAGITFNSCIVSYRNSTDCFDITLQRGTGADYNCGVVISNCQLSGNAQGVQVASSGTGANLGGGVVIQNCTSFTASALLKTADANISTSIPCAISNCFLQMGFIGNANASGHITEDYNLQCSGASSTNVTQGAHSIIDRSIAAIPHLGQAQLYGFLPEPPFSLMALGGAYGFGNASGFPTIDLLSNPRPSGTIRLLDFGTATSASSDTLSDTTKNWGPSGSANIFKGYTIKIISGTGAGQIKSINASAQTLVTVDGVWNTQPDNTSVYQIYDGACASSGKATAGSTTTLTDGDAFWGTNQWQGYTLAIDGGTGSGRTAVVTSNTSTALTFANIGATLDSTSTYQLYRGTDGNTINPTVGCFERGNSGIQETVTVHSGANAGRIPGCGYSERQIPVNASSTTLSVYAQFDANYSGPQPQLIVLNCAECGVPEGISASMGGVASGTWEQINLTITPTSSGFISVRLQSNSTTPTGTAYFDDFSVT